MTSWHESLIDRQIRQAQERGDFDDLPGAGKPIPGSADESYDENWWVKGLLKREKVTFVGPPAIALRKEYEDLAETVASEAAEATVREIVADLNERITKARRGPVEGPPVTVDVVDVEDVVRAWRERRRNG